MDAKKSVKVSEKKYLTHSTHTIPREKQKRFKARDPREGIIKLKGK